MWTWFSHKAKKAGTLTTKRQVFRSGFQDSMAGDNGLSYESGQSASESLNLALKVALSLLAKAS